MQVTSSGRLKRANGISHRKATNQTLIKLTCPTIEKTSSLQALQTWTFSTFLKSTARNSGPYSRNAATLGQSNLDLSTWPNIALTSFATQNPQDRSHTALVQPEKHVSPGKYNACLEQKLSNQRNVNVLRTLYVFQNLMSSFAFVLIIENVTYCSSGIRTYSHRWIISWTILGGTYKISSLHSIWRYCQILVGEKDIDITTFTSHDGTNRFNWIPLELIDVSVTIQRNLSRRSLPIYSANLPCISR